MSNQFDARSLAEQLENAWQTRQPLAPFTETGAIQTVDQAYAVQTEWEKIRLAAGDRILGRKIGLTSEAMRKQFRVDSPDYGGLWASRFYAAAPDGRTRVPLGPYLQARIEGEIAFHLAEPLAGPDVTVDDVLRASSDASVAAEIIDSRVRDWRIQLADTVADNASFGGFTHGPWDPALLNEDLSRLRMVVERNGESVEEGRGAIVLGHPAMSVAWLANKLADYGVTLDAGDIVLSGSLVASVPVAAGDEFVIKVDGQPPLAVVFE